VLSFIAALLNNWRVVLFLLLIIFVGGLFGLSHLRYLSAVNEMQKYQAENVQLKTATEKLSVEIAEEKKLAQKTNELLAQRENEKNAAEKQAATARKKYRNIVEGSRDACIDNAVPADVLGWLHDNTD